MSGDETQHTIVLREPPIDPGEVLKVLALDIQTACSKFSDTSLEKSWGTIYDTRSLRPLSDVLSRTIGIYDSATGEFEEEQFDARKNKVVAGELAELEKEILKWKTEPTTETALHAYFEAADIYFQLVSLQLRSDIQPQDKVIAEQYLGFACGVIAKNMITGAGLDFTLVPMLARLKYGVRAALQEADFKGKHDALETQLGLTTLTSIFKEQENDKRVRVLAELGVENLDQLWEQLSNAEFTIRGAVLKKYGYPLNYEVLDATKFRRIRPLTGPGSVMARIFGVTSATDEGTQATHSVEGIAHDTDITQLDKAINAYTEQPSEETKVEVLIRAAAFEWQREVVWTLHTPSEARAALLLNLEQRLLINQYKLNEIGINPTLVSPIAKILFGTRLLVDGMPQLERELCLRELDKQKNIGNSQQQPINSIA